MTMQVHDFFGGYLPDGELRAWRERGTPLLI